MKHPFSVLKPEYERRLASMTVTRRKEVDAAARRLLQPEIIGRHREVEIATGVPAGFLAVLFDREASSNFRLALGQGDPWNRKSVHVPRGHGPFPSWKAAAIHYVNYDRLNDNSSPWSLPYICWKGEAWNGFGPRAHGRPTGYLWSGTNIYDPPSGPGGKYVADGAWSGKTVDRQLGIVPVLMRMIALDPSLDDRFELPLMRQAPSGVPEVEPPVGVGGGARDAAWVQEALNRIGERPPLLIDDNYGRMTRAAVRRFQSAHALEQDGLAGPETIKAIEDTLDKIEQGSADRAAAEK